MGGCSIFDDGVIKKVLVIPPKPKIKHVEIRVTRTGEVVMPVEGGLNPLMENIKNLKIYTRNLESIIYDIEDVEVVRGDE